MMGWNVSSGGFRLVMSREVPKMADEYLRRGQRIPADQGLSIEDVSTWVCHPGGPKVIDSIENAMACRLKRWRTAETPCGERQYVLRVRA